MPRLNPIAAPKLTLKPVTATTLRIPGAVDAVFLEVTGAVTIPKIIQDACPVGGTLTLYAKDGNGGDITITRTAKNSAVEGSISTASGSNITLNDEDAVILMKRANGGWMDLATGNPT